MKKEQSKSPQKTKLRHLLRLVAPSFRAYRGRIVGGIIALITVDLLQLMIPKILQHGVDKLEAGTKQGELLPLGLAIIAIALLVVCLRFCWRTMIIGFSRILECRVREDLFSHVLQMDANFFMRNSTGTIMSHSSNDLQAVQMAFGMGIVAAIDSSVMLVAAIGFMMSINVKLTLIALAPLPILAIATRILAGKLHHRFTKVQEQFSKLTEFSRSTISSMRLVKAYTMEEQQAAQFDLLGKHYVHANLKVAVINGLMNPIATFIGNLAMLCVFFVGGRMVIKGVINLGDFVAFMTYIYMIIWPIMAIGWVVNLVQRGMSSLERIHKIKKQEPLITDGKKSTLPQNREQTITIKGLSFSYPGCEYPQLQDINLSFPPGCYGITGRTGSGKTSLCRLLCRLYPVEEKTYFMNGADVNFFTLSAIRSKISYVSQEPVLFSDTITANIAFQNDSVSQKEIEEAAHRADIHKDIMTLEHGYDTMIGEKGIKLSGGQRQRVALARALLAKRPILLIDDGLSAVDVETEHRIFSHLKKSRDNKIIIIVSNRMKLLSMTDYITILDEGRIAHQGTHEELLLTSALYQSMAEKQQDGEALA